MPANNLWSIAFGDYAFALDRAALTYSLTDTATGIHWAENLPVGWMEFEERTSGERERVAFGEMKRVSLSEKASAVGKRILLGLDWNGLPVDIYFTCAEREVQLTVEANRDTRTHKLRDTCLYPGLVTASDTDASYIALPCDGGRMFRPDDVAGSATFPVWADQGVSMPFLGAVRPGTSALALLTDSAYAAFTLTSETGTLSTDILFTRDPDRRRLDVRLAVLPRGGHVEIARAYRDRIIGEKNHVTLRRKMRERPELERAIGSVVYYGARPGGETGGVLLTDEGADGIRLADIGQSLRDDPPRNKTRWDDLDARMESIREASEKHHVVAGGEGGDWSAVGVDLWLNGAGDPTLTQETRLPLYAVVYHDAVIAPTVIAEPQTRCFLHALLNLSPPLPLGAELPERFPAILCPLHALTFTAFLTAHRFLTPDLRVEEAVYSDKTRVVVNLSLIHI